jgi:hypothetical protein
MGGEERKRAGEGQGEEKREKGRVMDEMLKIGAERRGKQRVTRR